MAPKKEKGPGWPLGTVTSIKGHNVGSIVGSISSGFSAVSVTSKIDELERRIEALEEENKMLREVSPVEMARWRIVQEKKKEEQEKELREFENIHGFTDEIV